MSSPPALLLSLAIVAEVIATNALRASDGFKYWPAVVVTALGYVCAFYLLGLSLKHIPVGAAYAIWSGVGTVLTAAIGYLVFRDALSAMSLLGIGLVIAGVVLIQLGKPALNAA
ncbi:MAG TPA: multidrug efflux SMR transporter [Aquabacterium sp.]|uniref:DMT family transporter n=1 Tax=Aquabacterium sp. TaxID=1872578 RepID=UPI002E3027C6|nr:multidrug efflux SMR transporter [Aquabacterium sp.]HEX5357095.1 multidrug efflux SMR transporter [Aquabacterium sp.]